MSIPSNCTNNDILDMFARLADLGASSFGEDADMFGDTLAEVVEDAPQGRDIPFKLQTIAELKALLTCSDEEIRRVSKVLLGINPDAEAEEPPNWGYFPSLRAFWSAVLHAFEHDPEVQEQEDA